MKQAQINISINTQNAIKSIGDLNKEIGGTVVTINDLKMTVEALQKELESTEYGTKRFEELKAALIEANTNLKNYELSIEALDHEQVASEIKSVVGGLTDMAAGLTLVGVSGAGVEKLVQTFALVEGASKIATGAIEGYQSMMKLSGTITATLTAWQTSLAAATAGSGVAAKAAAVGMRILNAVMNANPVFLLITGVTALVGAIGWLVTSTNEAAEANDKLNASLEAQNKLIEANRKARASINEVSQTQNKNQIAINNQTLKGLNLELENLKKKQSLNQKLSEDEQKRLQKLPGLIKEIEGRVQRLTMEGFSESVKEAQTQLNEDLGKIVDKVESVRLAIRATADEDGIDDIDYSAALKQVDDVVIAYNKLYDGFKNNYIATSDFKESVKGLINQSAKLSAEFTNLKFKMGSAEQEVWQNAITNADNLTNALNDVAQSSANLTKVQLETPNINWYEKHAKEQEAEKERLEKLEKQQEENRKKFLEARKNRLQEILDLMKREENANAELARAAAERADDEIKLIELSYGEERQRIIDAAVAREEAALQDKFANGIISEEKLKEGLKKINENYDKYLLDSERELLNQKAIIRDQEIEDIVNRLAQEAALTKEQTDVINANKILAEIQYQKERELLFASQEKDEEVRAQKILEIKKKYLDQEINAINSSLKEEKEARTQQYQNDIAQKDLTDEQKKNIQAQYDADIVTLEQNAQRQIDQLQIDSVANLEKTLEQKVEKIGQWVNAIGSLISQTVQTLQMAFDMQAEEAAARRESEYNAEAEALDAMLANREISQQQFDDKMKLLEQKKAQQELAAKRKAFQQNKALAIVSAVMNTAQAVIAAFTAGASLGPAGIVMGPVMAGIAGALGAVQIGLIASQKFTAARGGVVPGAPSKQDTVDAKLASGEMVINSESAQMFPQLLSAINQAGGGIALAPESTPQGNTRGGGGAVFASNMSQQPIKAYVVENEVTDTQRRVKRYERAAEF